MGFFKRLFLLLILLGVAAVGLFAWFSAQPVALKQSPLDFTIESGMALKQAAAAMHAAGVDLPAWQFTLFARVLRQEAAIKAGSYEIEAGITPKQLLDKLTRGDVSQGEIMLVEGRTFRQFRNQLDQSPDLKHDTTGLTDAEVLQRIGATEAHPEGLFFPDTYLFSKKSSDVDVLRRAYQAMQTRFAREWELRDRNMPYTTPYEALIMASIVEKETGKPTDRPMVASVFTNRLRAGMPLQTDPTVIYGLGERFDGNLRRIDLGTDTPYNTYMRGGLPPTPIAMPGLAAMRAALNPPASDKLYFVARGDGSSEFSSTLDEHNRAVNKYQRGHGSIEAR